MVNFNLAPKLYPSFNLTPNEISNVIFQQRVSSFLQNSFGFWSMNAKLGQNPLTDIDKGIQLRILYSETKKQNYLGLKQEYYIVGGVTQKKIKVKLK